MHDAAEGQGSCWQSEEELEGVGESGEEAAAEEQREDDEEEEASETLLQELWKDCSKIETIQMSNTG